METFSKPAYYMKPNSYLQTCGRAINRNFVSNWTLKKTIQIEIRVNRFPYRVLERVSRWWLNTNAPEKLKSVVIHSPMVVANEIMKKIYTFNVNSKEIIDITTLKNGTRDSWLPIIMATEDGSLAFSCYITVGYYTFNNFFRKGSSFASDATKITVINPYGDVNEGEEINSITYMVVGNLDQVKDDLFTLGGLL